MARPREITLPPEEMIKLGKEMIAWLKAHPETLHLSEWYTIEKMYTYNEWKSMIVKDEFYPYYEQALRLVGKKYLDKTTNVREGISQRWQRVYFKDLREQEDEDKIFESKLRTDEEKAKISPEALHKLDMLAQLVVESSSNPNLNNSKNNNNKD